jgi:beta-alanine--pyruvate transaminase
MARTVQFIYHAASGLVRQTADTIALSPPLIVEPAQIERLFETLSAALRG